MNEGLDAIIALTAIMLIALLWGLAKIWDETA